MLLVYITSLLCKSATVRHKNSAILLLTDLIVSDIIVLRSDGSSNSIAVMLDTALTSKLRISTFSGATKQGKHFRSTGSRNGAIDCVNDYFEMTDAYRDGMTMPAL